MNSNDWLVSALTREFAAVLQMMTSLEFKQSCSEGPMPDDDNYVWWSQPLSLWTNDPIVIGAHSETAIAIGRRSLEAAGVSHEQEEAHLSTYLEFVQQAMAGFVRIVSQRLGQAVECQSGKKDQAPRLPKVVHMELASDALDLKPFCVHLPAVIAAVQDSRNPLAVTTQHASRPELPNPVDLLLDVEMPVCISFGRTQLPLRDVLKFAVGSIIELNRLPEEPVEVVVNNCVIARGELVVIDGNYGVRIQQIMSRQQRMALREQERAAIAGAR